MKHPEMTASSAVTAALEAIRNLNRAQAQAVSFRCALDSGTSGSVSWPPAVEAIIRAANAAIRAIPLSELGEFRRLASLAAGVDAAALAAGVDAGELTARAAYAVAFAHANEF